jgi:hypothetical protein
MILSRYEQQLVWDAILEEYKRLEKMYKSYFKRPLDFACTLGLFYLALYL